MATDTPDRKWISGGGVHELLPDRILAPGRYLIERDGPEHWRILEGEELERGAEALGAETLGISVEELRARRAEGEAEQEEAAQYGLLPQQLRLARQIASDTALSLPLAMLQIAREQGVSLTPEQREAILAPSSPEPTPEPPLASLAKGKKGSAPPPTTPTPPNDVPVDPDPGVVPPSPEAESQQ